MSMSMGMSMSMSMSMGMGTGVGTGMSMSMGTGVSMSMCMSASGTDLQTRAVHLAAILALLVAVARGNEAPRRPRLLLAAEVALLQVGRRTVMVRLPPALAAAAGRD
jgi:hypothetical protein